MVDCGDQNADKMNLHDAHWFSDDHAWDTMRDLENTGLSDANKMRHELALCVADPIWGECCPRHF